MPKIRGNVLADPPSPERFDIEGCFFETKRITTGGFVRSGGGVSGAALQGNAAL